MKKVSVLFTRGDSNYLKIPECDLYDIHRNALTFPGGSPIVAHPPCRSWSRLSHFAKPRPGEKALAPWALYQVRENGGVLEHPSGSKLWRELGLPVGLGVDQYGGFTLSVDQYWWGHKAAKKTWLYVCGVKRSKMPRVPLRFGRPTHVLSAFSGNSDHYQRPSVSLAEREHTPPAFAEWLVEVARRSVGVNRPVGQLLNLDGYVENESIK